MGINRNNDFYKLLIDDDSIQKDAFWGKYKKINQLESTIGKNQLYFKIQIQKLQALENSKQKNYDTLNNLINEINSKSYEVYNIDNEIVQRSENQIYGRLLQIFNLGLGSKTSGSVIAEMKNKGNQQAGLDLALRSMNELSSLLNSLNIKEGIKANIIDLMDRRYKDIFGKQWQMGHGIQKFTKTYVQLKADTAEDLLMEILNAKGLRTLTTGSWLYKGKQLLEDNITIVKNIVFDKRVSFTQHFSNNTFKTFEVKSLNELFDQVNKLQGTYSISISNELYNFIQSQNVLSSQVKSGAGDQAILNLSKEGGRNTISLQEIWNVYDPKLLWDLYTSKTYFFDESHEANDLEGYANYALSKGIAETNLKRNQLYFSTKGITTASHWMEVTQQMLKFKGPLKSLSNKYISTKYPYYFTKV